MMLDVEAANAEVGKWLRDVANQRIHPVTNNAPAVLFEEQERCACSLYPHSPVHRAPCRC
ncbi:hypothetical protein H0A64_07300 [Alcaligenaceae bacterium]|nr:hypothetical protein [Alcaligenaceae bacterium]